MNAIKNESGSVLVFITLMIVLLLIMVGMGLDTGHLAYIRSQGQPAVDAAALAAASAVPTGNLTEVHNRAAAFNSKNTFQGSSDAQFRITNTSVTLVTYNAASGSITPTSDISKANGARVAIEDTNPYAGGTANKAMKSPLFLTPLFNLMGFSTPSTQSVSVSAVAVNKAQPDLPIAAEQAMCGTPPVNPEDPWPTQQKVKLLQSSAITDTSGYTTFYIQSASKTEIDRILDGSLTCTGAPSVDVGFCTELNNGQAASLYDEFETVFLAGKASSRCYFIPIVKTGASFNQCSNILDFAKFCPRQCEICGPDPTNVKNQTYGTDKAASGSDRWIFGDLTCGYRPANAAFAKCQVPSLVRDKPSGM